MGINCLYIVLTRTNTVFSKLIRLLKKDDYTHAAISFDKDLEQMYSFGRRNPYNPFIGKFRREDIHGGVYGFCKVLPGIVIEVEVTSLQYGKAKELLDQFINNQDYYKYNYTGLLNSILDKPSCYEDRFLCSEFVYYILKESGVVDLKISRNLVRPQSLLSIEGNVIFQGDLKGFKPKNINNLHRKAVRNSWFDVVFTR